MSICKDCFHSYVCEKFNEHRECDNNKCRFANDHFVSATDIVGVVRCKDCEFVQPTRIKLNGKDLRTCSLHKRPCYDNDFCSRGVLKERENNV